MKKGFTLLEVLAVLVLMGMIIGIVYIKVDKKIDSATTTELTESARNYISNVEMNFVNVDLNSDDLPSGTYQVASPNVINEKNYPSMNEIIGITENKPVDGYVTVNEDGKVTEASLTIRKYKVTYQNGSYEITES